MAANLAGIGPNHQETAMPAFLTTFSGTSTQPSAMCCSDPERFQLRFRSLFREGRGYSFPCDAAGCVDMDRLSERARLNYFFARALVGRDLHVPVVVPGEPQGDGAGDEPRSANRTEPAWRRTATRHGAPAR
jgi:hypothetical protein